MDRRFSTWTSFAVFWPWCPKKGGGQSALSRVGAERRAGERPRACVHSALPTADARDSGRSRAELPTCFSRTNRIGRTDKPCGTVAAPRTWHIGSGGAAVHRAECALERETQCVRGVIATLGPCVDRALPLGVHVMSTCEDLILFLISSSKDVF